MINVNDEAVKAELAKLSDETVQAAYRLVSDALARALELVELALSALDAAALPGSTQADRNELYRAVRDSARDYYTALAYENERFERKMAQDGVDVSAVRSWKREG